MRETFTYKGFYGSKEFSTEDECLMGEILFIHSKIIYVGESYPELKKAFEEAVDAYIQHCESKGIEPEKTLSGNFNIRISSDSHKQLALKSIELECSINACVNMAIDKFIHDSDRFADSITQVSQTLIDINTNLNAFVTVSHFNTYNSNDENERYQPATFNLNSSNKRHC